MFCNFESELFAILYPPDDSNINSNKYSHVGLGSVNVKTPLENTKGENGLGSLGFKADHYRILQILKEKTDIKHGCLTRPSAVLYITKESHVKNIYMLRLGTSKSS